MIIVKILGGFASQFNKYAWTKKLADALETELCLDISEYVQGYFRPFMLEYLCIDDCKVISDISLIEHVLKVHDGDELLQHYNSGANLYIYKEEQDYEAFFKIYPEYRIDSGWEVFQKLRLKKESNFVTRFQNKIKDVYSVAVHIRRGDFVTLGINDQIDEYQAAIGYVLKKNQNARIYFFSNDIEWVKEQFGANDQFYYINNENGSLGDIEDFLCMAACNLRILSSLSGYGKLANMLSKTLRADSDGAISLQRNTWEQDIYTLSSEECEEGLDYYVNQIFSNISVYHIFLGEKQSMKNACATQKGKIIFVTQESRVEWMYNRCFLISMILGRKGYNVLYLNLDKNVASTDLVPATNMDNQKLGFFRVNSKIGTRHLVEQIENWEKENEQLNIKMYWDYQSFEGQYVLKNLFSFIKFWRMGRKKWGRTPSFLIIKKPHMASVNINISQLENENEIIGWHEDCYNQIVEKIRSEMDK